MTRRQWALLLLALVLLAIAGVRIGVVGADEVALLAGAIGFLIFGAWLTDLLAEAPTPTPQTTTQGWPVPSQYGITTPYGKRGSYWSCNENSAGDGIHTGVDFACPTGTPLYATIAGEVRHRSYGSAFGGHQFAISPDPGQPFADGEVFYAHARSRVADGTRVNVGDKVGESGAEGNVSGAHLHYEFHPHSKGKWNCSVVADPAPTLGGASDGPYVTDDIYSDKLGYGEPSNGDESSDTIKELQERLNRVSLKGGTTIPITGRYDDATDNEVRLWQEQVCGDVPDPAGGSYLGPAQRAAMFPSSVYTMHDTGLPPIAGGGQPPTGDGTTLGRWLAGQGFTVEDEDVPLGRESEWDRVRFIMVHHTASPTDGSEAGIARYVREGEEGTFPPLAQIMLGQSGTVWMTCQERGDQPDPGRASHAGEGSGYGVPDDTMNEVCLGIECQADGSKPLSAYSVLYDELIRLLVALCGRYDVPVDNIIGHKEWSSTGKKDPLDDMDALRDDVSAAMGGEPPVPPLPPEYPNALLAARIETADGATLYTYWPRV